MTPLRRLGLELAALVGLVAFTLVISVPPDRPIARPIVTPQFIRPRPPASPTPTPTPELRPRVIFDLTLRDVETDRPVKADVFMNGEIAGKNRGQYRLLFQARQPGVQEITLRFEASGYQSWEKTFRYYIERGRIISHQIKLTPEESAVAPAD